MFEQETAINDAIIQKTFNFLGFINRNSLSSNRTNMKFSNRRFWRSKKSNKFKRYISHGEIGDIPVPKIAQKLPIIRKKLADYYFNDAWNADELAQFYKLAPESTIGPGKIPRKKKILTITFRVQISQKCHRNHQNPKCTLSEGPLLRSLKTLTFRTFSEISDFT